MPCICAALALQSQHAYILPCLILQCICIRYRIQRPTELTIPCKPLLHNHRACTLSTSILLTPVQSSLQSAQCRHQHPGRPGVIMPWVFAALRLQGQHAMGRQSLTRQCTYAEHQS